MEVTERIETQCSISPWWAGHAFASLDYTTCALRERYCPVGLA